MNRKKSLLIGPRTQRNILQGKNIRKNEVGDDIFEDYWTDSDDESYRSSKKSYSLSKKTEEALGINEDDSEQEVTLNFRTSNKILRPSKPGRNSFHQIYPQDNNLTFDVLDRHKELNETHTVSRQKLDASSSSKTFNKQTEISETKKRNKRSTASLLPEAFDKTIKKPKKYLESTDGSALSKTSDEKMEMVETSRNSLKSNINNLIEKDDINKLSKTKIFNYDAPNASEFKDAATPLSETYINKSEMSTTPKRLVIDTSNCAIEDVNMLPKTNCLSSPEKADKETDLEGEGRINIKKKSTASKQNVVKDVDNALGNISSSKASYMKKFSLVPKRISEIHFQNSKKSNVMTNNNVAEILSHYDEYDAKIMQMLRKNTDPKESVPNSIDFSNKEFLTQQPSRSTSKQTVKSSVKICVENISDGNEPVRSSTYRDEISKSVNNDGCKSYSDICVPERDNLKSVIISKESTEQVALSVSPSKQTLNDNYFALSSAKNVNSSKDIQEKANESDYNNQNNRIPPKESAVTEDNIACNNSEEKVSKDDEMTPHSSCLNNSAELFKDAIENAPEVPPLSTIPGSNLLTRSRKRKGKKSKSKNQLSSSNLDQKPENTGKKPDKIIKVTDKAQIMKVVESNDNISDDLNNQISSNQNIISENLESVINKESTEKVALPVSPSKHILLEDCVALSSAKNVNSCKNTQEKANKKIIESDYNNQNNQVSSNESAITENNIVCNSNKEKEPIDDEMAPQDLVQRTNCQQSTMVNIESPENIGEKTNEIFKVTGKKQKVKVVESNNIGDDGLSYQVSSNQNTISEKNISSKSGKTNNPRDNKMSPQSSSLNNLLNISEYPVEDVVEKSALPVIPEEVQEEKSVGDQLINTDLALKTKHLHHSAVVSSENIVKLTRTRKKKVKPPENDHDDDDDGEHFQSGCISPNRIMSEEYIGSSSTVEEAKKSEEIKETPLQLSQRNILGDSECLNENVGISEIHNISESTKRQKAVGDKATSTKQNKKDVYKQNSLNTRDSSQESASHGKEDLSRQSQKRKKKSVKPKNVIDNLSNVRRSSRQRFTPLSHWRNERLLYRFEKGDVKILGIDPGTKEDDFALRQLLRTKEKSDIKNKTDITKKPKKVKIYDQVDNQNVYVNLHQKFSLVPWDSPVNAAIDEKSGYSYVIKRMIETEKFSFGYLQIKSGQEKPKMYMPEEDLTLTLIEGEIEITIQKNVLSLTNKDMCIVPRQCVYSIKNLGKKTAFLTFAVGQFNCLED